MFDRLRRKGMTGVQLDASGWTLAMDRPDFRAWSTRSSDTVEEWHFEGPPDLQAPLTEIGELRRSFREVLDPMSGLIEVTPTVIDGVERCGWSTSIGPSRRNPRCSISAAS